MRVALKSPVSKISVVVTLSLILVTAMIFTSIVGRNNKDVDALSVSDWNAGKIIDDFVFTNTGTMNAGQIQTFLNGKVPVCDTYGTQPSEFGGGTRAQWAANVSLHPNMGAFYPPFTCLKDYTEGGLSSAQIIYNTAQEFQINPQVLIVLLQKEQALVTDTWPSPTQYRSATGYGCPDSAPCDSQYYGLSNQLRWAARMFRAILNNSPTWYTPYLLGEQTIYYNPGPYDNANNKYYGNVYNQMTGASMPDITYCGGSTVTIQNRSTQALYNYTPYQPNSGTLNWKLANGPSVSSGWPGCGAFGNINFFLYFTEWFGSVRAYRGIQPSSSTDYARAVTCRINNFASQNVGRLYNPDSGDYLFTANRQEACQAVRLGYIWDGIVFNSVGQEVVEKTPVYRLQYLSLHYYTTSLSQRDNYLAQGFRDEGTVMYLYNSSVANSIPVYGLEKPGSSDLFTSSGGEGTYFVNELGYVSSGIMGYVQLDNVDPEPLFRLRKANDRLYTSSQGERTSALTLGYTNEGTTLSVDRRPDLYNQPVYRLLSPTGLHFYTTSREERDLAVINYGHHSEGTGFYTPPSNLPGAQPVYRMTNYRTGNTRLYTQYSAEVGGARTYFGFTSEGIGWYGY